MIGSNSTSVPPRKQIIGFAKFKTRHDALVARDQLQGKRVDIEKGAVLKAEMAKKNLHTKRGVGSVPVPPIAPGAWCWIAAEFWFYSFATATRKWPGFVHK
jgi:hypothetical protein